MSRLWIVRMLRFAARTLQHGLSSARTPPLVPSGGRRRVSRRRESRSTALFGRSQGLGALWRGARSCSAHRGTRLKTLTCDNRSQEARLCSLVSSASVMSRRTRRPGARPQRLSASRRWSRSRSRPRRLASTCSPRASTTTRRSCPRRQRRSLGYIAARTERIILSTATTLITTNDPVKIAEDYSMLQHLAGGRVDLMLGRGNQRAGVSVVRAGHRQRHRARHRELRAAAPPLA